MSLTDFQIEEQRGIGGDLVHMLTVQDEMKDPVYYYIKPTPDRTARQTETVPNNAFGFPSTRYVGPGTKKLLFIGDSFSHSMMQFLPGYFRESFFVRDNKLEPALLQAEKPDIVVIEVVERNISYLANF
jgi:hypothetical protein